MDADEVHDKYIEIIANNWTMGYWHKMSMVIRGHHYLKIHQADGAAGYIFTRLWGRTFSLVEEVRLSGEATSVISHPDDR